MQHGILDSADCWVTNTPDVAPAFVLARAGYDVWLGNSRGNKYSKQHINPSISHYDYWNFDWGTMGMHDLPGAIDYVLKVTGKPKLAYIGHSQGTTQMFYGLAKNEDYFASRVSVFIALGPVTRLDNCKSSLLQFFSHNGALLIDTCNTLGIYEFFPANYLDTGAMKLLCGVIPALCRFGVYLVADEDTSLDNADRLNVYLGHFPAGSSLKCLNHYSQLINSKQFQEFDFGSKGN
jgi:lysosomal acid lipase/cholesteryl ester hydrolase